MKISKTIGQRPLPSSHLQLIGEIAVEWGWLEYRLQEAIWYLVCVNRKTGRSITSQMEIRGWLRSLKSLAESRIDNLPIRSKVIRLAGDIEGLIHKRNRLVHGIWDFEPTAGQATVQEFRHSGPLGQATAYDAERLSKFRAQLQSARHQLKSLMDQAKSP